MRGADTDAETEVPTRLTPSVGEFLHAIISDSNTDNTFSARDCVIQLLSLLAFSLEHQSEGGNDIPVPEEARETYLLGLEGEGGEAGTISFVFLSSALLKFST